MIVKLFFEEFKLFLKFINYSSAHTKVLEEEITDLIDKFETRARVTNIFTSTSGNDLDVSMIFTVQNDPRPHELDIVLERVR